VAENKAEQAKVVGGLQQEIQRMRTQVAANAPSSPCAFCLFVCVCCVCMLCVCVCVCVRERERERKRVEVRLLAPPVSL